MDNPHRADEKFLLSYTDITKNELHRLIHLAKDKECACMSVELCENDGSEVVAEYVLTPQWIIIKSIKWTDMNMQYLLISHEHRTMYKTQLILEVENFLNMCYNADHLFTIQSFDSEFLLNTRLKTLQSDGYTLRGTGSF